MAEYMHDPRIKTCHSELGEALQLGLGAGGGAP